MMGEVLLLLFFLLFLLQVINSSSIIKCFVSFQLFSSNTEYRTQCSELISAREFLYLIA